MYPDYNMYNQYYRFDDYNYRSSVPTNMYNDEIVTLNQAIEMIRESVAGEREDELFYDNLNFSNEFSDEEIVASLMKFQYSLVDDFNNSMRLELSYDCYQHPKVNKNHEKKTDTIALIIITAVLAFLVLMLVNGYTSR